MPSDELLECRLADCIVADVPNGDGFVLSIDHGLFLDNALWSGRVLDLGLQGVKYTRMGDKPEDEIICLPDVLEAVQGDQGQLCCLDT